MELITQAEFSRQLGLSRQSISKAIKSGKLRTVVQGKKKLIDLHDNLSVLYMTDQNASRDVARDKKQLQKKKSKKNNQELDPFSEGVVSDTDIPEELHIGNNHNAQDDSKEYSEAYKRRNQLNEDKTRAQVQKIKVDVARSLNVLIPRMEVDKTFDLLSSVLLNYLFPMGDRLSGRIAGVFENSDAEKIANVKDLIDTEISRALEAFKKAAIDAMLGWRKNE